MLTKRIIPCLDIKDGRTVKGTNFVGLRDAGDPVELAAQYAAQGADELVFLDITATVEGRKTFVELVTRIAQVINIPFTVGGGISEVGQVSTLLRAGADKVSVNSAAVSRPGLIDEIANEFGSQCLVVAIDTRRMEDGTERVHTHGGRIPTEWETVAWATEVDRRGAGEILLTSMDADGTGAGFALDITRRVAAAVRIPVVASGGGGTAEHFAQVFRQGGADAALAASIFHYGTLPVPVLKETLRTLHFPIR
ncbi:MAG: imidazole glycerol phosphate synthase subunit HisF [Bacteroidetes bacterium]|jgi:cyclase|nr:imidazole glycerol phosphate synthase subunit HisF [Bacteroidota bacterium]